MITNYNELSAKAFLPNALKRGNSSIILSVIIAYEDFFRKYFDFWFSLYLTCDPMLIDASLLDWLATETGNPWRNLWSSDFKESTKRRLLRDTYTIFSKRLFPDTIVLLFQDFDLLATLRPKTGFILGDAIPPGTPLPATIGTSILDYEIVIPPSYFQGSIEYNQVKYIAENFGIPGKTPIVYSS